MSKNFELMQQARIGIGGSATLAGVAIGASTKEKSESAVGAIAVAPDGVREESLKLVHRLFLTPGQTPPKAVMFAGIDPGNGCSRLCAITAHLLAESISGSVCLLEGN